MMGQVVQIGAATLIQGDMRDVLPQLGERAALVLSDPPYMLTSGGNSTGEMGGCFAPGAYDNSGALFPMVDWADMAPLMFAAARDDADAIIMANDKNMFDAHGAFTAAGWGFHRTLVWNKGTVTPNRWFMQGLEFGLYLWRGRARVINDCSAHPLVRVAQRDETAHPTEKPVSLMRRWIELTTAPGDLVLDPFMGSGSTAVAAVLAGRRFIGVEILPQWFEASVARVHAAQARRQSEFALEAAE